MTILFFVQEGIGVRPYKSHRDQIRLSISLCKMQGLTPVTLDPGDSHGGVKPNFSVTVQPTHRFLRYSEVSGPDLKIHTEM